MLRLAWKNIRHNPKRLILTTVSVVLGVAFVSAIHVFSNSIDSRFESLFDDIYAGGGVYVGTPSSFQFGDPRPDGFDAAVADAVAAVDGVEEVVPAVQTAAVILDKDGDVPPQGAPNLFYNWTDNTAVSNMEIVAGRPPAANGEATMDVGAMERLELEIGDTFQVAAPTGVETFTLVGQTTFAGDNQLAGASIVHLTMADVQRIAEREGQYTQLVAFGGSDTDTAALVTDIQAAAPGLVAIDASVLLEQQKDAFREQMQIFDIFTLAFAIIALYVGSFIIANTFRVIVTQRTREIGLLRAMGASPNAIRQQVLLEALIIGLIASVIGIGLGYLLALGLVGLSALNGAGASFGALTIPLDAVLWGFGVGILVTTVSALLPALHASSIKPIEALRESATQSRKPLKLRDIVGWSLIGAAAVAIGLGLWADVPQPAIWVGVGAVLLVQGVALAAAHVLQWLATASRPLLGKVFGLNGRLAASNVAREPRRSAITASALMIGVLLLALVATVTESAKAVARDFVLNQTTAQFIVSPDFASGAASPVSEPALEALRATPGVDVAAPLAVSSGTVDGNQVDVGILDGDDAVATFNYDTTPSFSELDDGEAFIGPLMVDLGYEVGDTIDVVGPTSTQTVKVVGLYNVEGDAAVYLSWDTGHAFDADADTFFVYIKAADGANLDDMQARLEQTLEDWPLLIVSTPSDFVESINGFIDFLLVMVSIMLSASLVIAVLGVANTLYLSITERTREVGLLRAVGLRRKQLRGMITVESVVIAVFGALLGILFGVLLGVALVVSLKSYGFTDPTIPWIHLGVYTILAILAGIVAALWPARKASKLDILEAIGSE